MNINALHLCYSHWKQYVSSTWLVFSQYTRMFLASQLFPHQFKVSLELDISDTDIILFGIWILFQMDW